MVACQQVLSPSTSRADRVTKRTVYHEEGVETYRVVDLDVRAFERSVTGDARIEVMAHRIEWHPAGAVHPFILDVEEFFRRALDA